MARESRVSHASRFDLGGLRSSRAQQEFSPNKPAYNVLIENEANSNISRQNKIKNFYSSNHSKTVKIKYFNISR